MKLLNIVILSTYAIAAFAAFDGQGKHDDGRFLSGSVKGRKACADGEFNLLEPDPADATIPKGYDVSTELITNCMSCTNGVTTFKAVYAAQASGFAYAPLNRKECCYNEDLAPCREMLQAYQEGCNRGGTAGGNRPYKDAGAAGTCAS
jgi:hypothetical protein